MFKNRKFYGGLCGIALLAPSLALAATPPTAGYYVTTGYTVSATPASACKLAEQVAGTSYGGIFYYPGPGKTGATFREPVNGKSGASIGLQTFPKTPAAGVTNYSGTLVQSTEGVAGGNSLNFTATFTFLDSSSFQGKFVVTIPLGTISCVVTDELVFVKTGS
jgi:hypothetical protein